MVQLHELRLQFPPAARTTNQTLPHPLRLQQMFHYLVPGQPLPTIEQLSSSGDSRQKRNRLVTVIRPFRGLPGVSNPTGYEQIPACIAIRPGQPLTLQPLDHRLVRLVPYVDSYPIPPQPFGRYQRGRAPAERVQHNIPFVRRRLDDSLVQRNRFLSRITQPLPGGWTQYRLYVCPPVILYRALPAQGILFVEVLLVLCQAALQGSFGIGPILSIEYILRVLE